MHVLFLPLFSLFAVFSSFSSHADGENGTLIVSYDTGEKGERLNRVRFLLVSEEDHKEEIYPKGEAFIEGHEANSRLIAIENLPVGNYRLKFLIPNADNLFDPIPERSVTIIKNQVLRIDQSIHPRYATLKAKASLPSEAAEKQPILTLHNQQGMVRAQSVTGKLVVHYLVPGSYSLTFEPIEGYQTPEPVELNVTAGMEIGPLIGTYVPEGEHANNVAQSVLIRRPRGPLIINQLYAQLTINNNLQRARWTLVRNGVPVFTGIGSVTNFRVPDGDNYRIIPENIEGYTVRVNPSSFDLYATRTTYVSVVYERSFGTVYLQASFPEGEMVAVHFRSRTEPPFSIKLRSKGGKIFWQSRPLPTGPYEISYELPDSFTPVPPDNVIIRRGEQIELNPKLMSQGQLHVVANVPEAIFLLRSLSDSKVWRGEGREYTFRDIPAGVYQLTFSTQQPEHFVPPKEVRVIMNDLERKEVKAGFQIAGKLMITTNLNQSHLTIQELGGQQQTYQDQMLNRTKTFILPEGQYRVTMTNPTEPFSPPDPVNIAVKALRTQEVNLPFRRMRPPEKQNTLIVNTNVPSAAFSVYKLSGQKQELVERLSGKTAQIRLPGAGKYEVVFDDIPNYQSPEKIAVDIREGEEKNIEANYASILSIVEIPAGRAIIGDATSEENINELPAKIVNLDAFAIGTYEVTNAQYAEWLNEAIKAGTIAYVKEADNKGQVLDTQGRLLFKTFEADSYSQISAQQQSTDTPMFAPLAGKDSYPVINVSWYGATAYCKDNKCRLPTEAEWEKAAGMAPEEKGKPLKKFVFGFGRNEIDPSWANYKESEEAIEHFRVLTTPVGFYDGVNVLPLSAKSARQERTHLAKSPYGAFDMSGNVWEWVSDWYDSSYYDNMPESNPKGPATGSKKVAKGGCYDSLADGVRVAERLGLPPDHTDAYTGFRIAIDR